MMWWHRNDFHITGLLLTHWGRVTHICVSKLTIIGSDNGLSPDRRQTIIWTNAGLLLIAPLGTNFGAILIGILAFSFKKMRLKVSSAKRRPFCFGLNVLRESPVTSVQGPLVGSIDVFFYQLEQVFERLQSDEGEMIWILSLVSSNFVFVTSSSLLCWKAISGVGDFTMFRFPSSETRDSVNEIRRYNVSSPLIGWSHTQVDPWILVSVSQKAPLL